MFVRTKKDKKFEIEFAYEENYTTEMLLFMNQIFNKTMNWLYAENLEEAISKVESDFSLLTKFELEWFLFD